MATDQKRALSPSLPAHPPSYLQMEDQQNPRSLPLVWRKWCLLWVIHRFLGAAKSPERDA